MSSTKMRGTTFRTTFASAALALLLPAFFGIASTETSSSSDVPVRVAVQSSVIATIAYDGVRRALDIEFRSGAVWRYFDVLPEIHRAFLDADSKGRFYNANIRHRFKSHKIGGR